MTKKIVKNSKNQSVSLDPKRHLGKITFKGGKVLRDIFFCLFLILQWIGCTSVQRGTSWKERAVFLAFSGNYPIVELLVYPSEKNYAPPIKLRFLLDTGSNLSFVRKDFLPVRKAPEKYISYTINGATEINIHKLLLELDTETGHKLSSEQLFHLIDFRKEFPFDGILGNDFLQKFTLLYNHPEGLYVISGDVKELEKDFTIVNVLPEIKSHLVIPVELEKSLVYFLLDTGAEISYLDEEHIKKLKLDAYTTRKYSNFTGDIRESNTYILPTLCVQENLCSDNVELLGNQNLRHFLGQGSIRVSGLFGMNWLKNYYLLVKHPERKVLLKSKRG